MRKLVFLSMILLLASCGVKQEKEGKTVIGTEEISIQTQIEGGENSEVLNSTSIGLNGSIITKEFIETHYGESLVGGVDIVDCKLSSGKNSSCYKFTVAPDATRDHKIGPWCPRNISETEEAGGVWPDDGKIYQVSGDFIKNLAVFYEDDNWKLYDTETGEINVTDTKVSCEGAAKPDVEEEYKNHCVECSLTYMDEIPNVTYTIPLNPIAAEKTSSINNQLGVGVAFNGVKFDASAPTSAILSANTIAPFDDCGGHINLHAGYHYHESTGCSKQVEALENDAPMIGLALDGFPMHQQVEDAAMADLDACGGHIVDGQYHYHISETGTNQFLGCYAGEYGCTSADPDAVCDASATTSRKGPGGGQDGDRPPRPEGEEGERRGPPPSE